MWWKRKPKPQKITQKTNEMLARIQPALHNRIGQWRLIECGRYQNKPTLSRALRYLAGFKSDQAVEAATHEGRIRLNTSLVAHPHMRLGCGSYTVHIKGQGEYRFHIR